MNTALGIFAGTAAISSLILICVREINGDKDGIPVLLWCFFISLAIVSLVIGGVI